MGTLDRADVQGLVMSGYARMHAARFLLLVVRDPAAARRWVGALSGRTTAAVGPEERWCRNVAFTADGLAALGVGDAALASFPQPFREGMAAPHRRRLLGDTGASDPSGWAWGRPDDADGTPDDQVHAVLLLYARDEADVAALEGEEVARLEAGGLAVVRRLVPEPLPARAQVGKFGVEHFGFAHGMSQPVLAGSGRDAALGGDEARRTVVAAGEFVLGQPNGYGQLTPWPRLPIGGPAGDGFGLNGTYLVVRQLAQDVAGFWRAVDAGSRPPDGGHDPDAVQRLAAKLVGRWPSGAPLVRSPHRDDPDLGTDNAFAYADLDPYGDRCPLGAHIRRANPRDALGADPATALERANLHRLLRRGRAYGPPLDDVLGDDDGRERGLLFLCLNASIERQFEYVQHTWIGDPGFAGLEGEADPLLGARPAAGATFTIQGEPVRTRVHGLPRFVTVRGGAYFFLPGLRALRSLAALGD